MSCRKASCTTLHNPCTTHAPPVRLSLGKPSAGARVGHGHREGGGDERLVARGGDVPDLSAVVPGLRTGTGSATSRGSPSGSAYVADLGVDAVWLSPIFISPMADMGYDVSDYTDIDPIFGSLADFDAMLARAHALGLKVVIDQVLSHSSDQHPFFAESRSSRDNPKADWYVWADPKHDGTPPNNWLSVFGGPAWAWDARRHQYYLHNFLAEQPDFNFHNPEVQDVAALDDALLAGAGGRRVPARHGELLLPRQAAARRSGRLPAEDRAGGQSLRDAVPPLLEEPAGEPRLPRGDAEAPRRLRGAGDGGRDGREPPRDPDDGGVHDRQAAA